MDNYFIELCRVNVSEYTEKKGNLTYLSWVWAWSEIKKRHPNANYKIYEDENGNFYHTDGKTGWVKTGVTVNNIEHIEYLPIMDFKNKSIPLEKITSVDVNKTIQRSLTKGCARHGLGLYVYAGEDIPKPEPNDKDNKLICKKCGQTITDYTHTNGCKYKAQEIAQKTNGLCFACGVATKNTEKTKNEYRV